MDIYLLIGEANTRKSSFVRALGGFSKSGQKFDVALINGKNIKVCCHISALQEDEKQPNEFVKTIKTNNDCNAFLIPLRIKPVTKKGITYPSYSEYINEFIKAGFTIKFIEVLDAYFRLNIPSLSISHVTNSNIQATNKTVNDIRKRWGWF